MTGCDDSDGEEEILSFRASLLGYRGGLDVERC